MTNYVITFQSEDPTHATKILAAIASMDGVIVSSFSGEGVESTLPTRPVLRQPYITKPDQLKGQSKFIYDLLADGMSWSIVDMTEPFAIMYPTVRQPSGAVGSLIRVLYKRGFVQQDDNRKYYRPKQK